jgi:hypothetical protein
MDLNLVFVAQAISGDGSDDVGRFMIAGHFDETIGDCAWTKTYLAAHAVYYRGFREGKGIWGVWELTGDSGGFHIWPFQEGALEHEEKDCEETVPLEGVGTQAT